MHLAGLRYLSGFPGARLQMDAHQEQAQAEEVCRSVAAALTLASLDAKATAA